MDACWRRQRVDLSGVASWGAHVTNGRTVDESVLTSCLPCTCMTGMDATDEFNAIHSTKAKKMLVDYYIGDLAPPGVRGHLMQPPSCCSPCL